MNRHDLLGPFNFTPDALAQEAMQVQAKLRAGLETLHAVDDVQYGATAREEVWRDGKVVLYRFVGEKAPTAKVPLLIVYALVNRPYMVDLQHDRSLVKGLLAQGEDVYVIDWGYPDGSDRFLTFDDYVSGYLARCVDVVRDASGHDRINLLGVCQGGTLSLCYAALHRDRLRNLVTMVTPVDFQTPKNLLTKWTKHVDLDALVATTGNVPGEMLNALFLGLQPFRLTSQKYVDLLDHIEDPKALENFLGLQRARVLQRETEPCLYVYQQQMGSHVQRGLVAGCHVDDYDAGIIKKHEKTRKDKEDDRTRHVLALDANAEPVFLTYRPELDIDALVAREASGPPLYDFTADDGVRHTVWKVKDAAPLVAAFRSVPVFYVADGHHRSASAWRAGQERKKANPSHTGNEEYNWFLAVLFPSDQLAILPYNRVVKDLNGLTPAQFIERLEAIGQVSETTDPVPPHPGSFCFFLEGRWIRFTLDPATIDASDPIGSLDVSLLQARFYLAACELHEARTNEGAANLERVIAAGESPYLEDARFLLAQARIEQRDIEGARQELRRVIALQGDRREQAQRLLDELR